MRGVILSRTYLGNGMCTVVGVWEGDNFTQYRLLNPQGNPIGYHNFSYKRGYVEKSWVFGRELELPKLRCENPRPTHPEDRRVNPSEIRILEGMRTFSDLEPFLKDFTFDSLKELFPLAPGERYVTEQRLQRSVGYVHGVDVEITAEGSKGYRASIKDPKGLELTNIPIKGVELTRYLKRQFEKNGNRAYKTYLATVRFSLATPWAPGHGPRVCYLQISDVHESAI